MAEVPIIGLDGSILNAAGDDLVPSIVEGPPNHFKLVVGTQTLIPTLPKRQFTGQLLALAHLFLEMGLNVYNHVPNAQPDPNKLMAAPTGT